MKFSQLFVVAVVATLASAAPGKKQLLRDSEKDTDEVETFANPRFPVINFGQTFQDMFEVMRRQMMALLGGVPFVPGNLGPGNMTSVTKVVDGHKFVINETTYVSGTSNGNNTNAVFKVQVIDIRPDSSESLEGSVENEIPKDKTLQKHQSFGRLESFDDIESAASDTEELAEPIYLGNDVYVNELAANDPNRVPEPDAEVFQPRESVRPAEAFEGAVDFPGELSNELPDASDEFGARFPSSKLHRPSGGRGAS